MRKKLISEIIAAVMMVSITNSVQAGTESIPIKKANADSDEGALLQYSKLPGLAPAEILPRLEHELGRPAALNYFLPPAVIAKAFLDDEFKNALLRNPSQTLRAMGYPPADYTCIVHENTERTRHLILDTPPNDVR